MKALLVKKWEKLDYVTDLRRLSDQPSAAGIGVGFSIPLGTQQQLYGFDVERNVPCDRWLRHKQQTMHNVIFQALFQETVHDLQSEIPGLGDTSVIDTKHIYAWVKENNPREFITNRYDPEKRPSGDPDCRLGVKRSKNQDDNSGQVKVEKEYLWGYGRGIMAATHPKYGDVVLAEYTLPFNEADFDLFCTTLRTSRGDNWLSSPPFGG